MTYGIKNTVDILSKDKAIIFPTETVFALAADATSDEAVRSLFNLKKRDANLPISIMVANIEDLNRYVFLPEKALQLANKYWPGELTLVLPQKEGTDLSELINYDTGYLGVRIPDHKTALNILNEFKKPIAATSVNISGMNPAITKEEAAEYFNDVHIVDGENPKSKIASTVIKIDKENNLQVLRQGAIIV